MMNDDKLFRDRLFNMEASYPDDMWDRISGQLPKKKRGVGWWLFIAFLFVSIISSFFLPLSQESKSTENYKENLLKIDPASDNKVIVQGTSGQINQEINETVSPTPPENAASITAVEIYNNEPVKDESLSVIHHKPTTSTFDLDSKVEDLPVDNNNKTEIIVNNESNEEVENIAAPRALVSIPGSINSRQLLIDNVYPEFVPPECPTFGFDREPGIFFDLLYSHDMPGRTLELKSQETSDYINSRNNTESTLYSFSASLRIAYISKSGLGVKTGFNYSQINEKFKYLDPDASLIRTIITIDTLIVGGVPTVITDTSTIRIPGSLDITAYNRYRFFDFPIMATYEAPLNDKFYYSFNGGVLINVAFSQKGKFLDPSGMPVSFTSSDPDGYDAFKNSAGLSFFGSLGLHYKLNDHLDIIIEPNFRFYAGSLTSEPYPLEQRWLTLGLSHGIRYKF